MSGTMKDLTAYKSIAQPTRLKIVLTIAKSTSKNGLTFNGLKRKLDLNSNVLDHHLRELISADLLVNEWRPRQLQRKVKELTQSARALYGTRFTPEVTGKTIPQKSHSYYKLTSLCDQILGKLGLHTKEKIEETLNEIERKKELLKENPIF